jgi:hypothetical protein
MVINGKILTWQDCVVPYKKPPDNFSINNTMTDEFIWVAYDNSDARLPVAIAPSVNALSEAVGVNKSTIMSSWSKFIHGQLSEARYAKVYIGGSDDDE